jgi:hypothetical protein
MNLLSEVRDCRQVRGEPPRRWFGCDQMDLIVWCDDAGAPIGFQLCYDLGRTERALTWKPTTGFQHNFVDDGESGGPLRPKGSPVLVPDGAIDFVRLGKLFAQANAQMPAEISTFVTMRLQLAGAPPPKA